MRLERFFVAAVAVASLAPAGARAQQFKVDKYDIGGTGGTDYVTAEAGTARVFVSRATHVMVVDGLTGKVLGDIPDTPRMHGIGLAPKSGHGFTTNAGDSTVTMFDLKTYAFLKKIKVVQGGMDGIMYDADDDLIILTNHSKTGQVTAIKPSSGDIVGTVELADNAPEGAVQNGKGWIYVNGESKNTIEVVDVKTWKVVKTWPTAPCEGPTGIAYDKATDRIFSGCSKKSVVVNGTTGAIVAVIDNGDRVDALGYDASQKLIYIPCGAPGNVVVVHQDAADKYTTVATVTTFTGAKTIAVDPVKHMAFLFQPEYGPAPASDPNAPPPAAGRGRGGPPRPIVAAWFISIKQ